jgi:hypothetical protein
MDFDTNHSDSPVQNDKPGSQAQPEPPAPASQPGLLAKLESLQEQVAKAHAAMERIERARRIEHLLQTARATDVRVAAELVEHTLAESGGKMEVEAAIQQVRRKRPGLFKPASPPASAMSGRTEPAPDEALSKLAERIGAGDHRSIMDYMRARRRS